MVGEGILKGLAETARNFFGSYVSKDRLTTIQYPEERLPQIEATRNFPFLVYDGSDWQQGMRCVACQICEKECPPKCIFIEKSADKKPDAVGKPQFYPAVFDIDISVCMSCQICVEVCPFDAIKMDVEYELPTDDRFGGLLLDKQKLAKSTSTTTRSILRKRPPWMPRSPKSGPKLEAKAKAAAEAKAASRSQAHSRAATPQPADGESRMIQTLDQIFVIAKHWLLGFVPPAAQPLASAILSVVPVLIAFPLLFAITTWLERKGLGRIQNRYGPNRTGPFGLLQPIADAVKSLTKEDIVPLTADQLVHFLAPLVLVMAAFLAYAVLPIGRNMVLVNLNAGVLFFFAVGSIVELSVFMAGWSSRSKYSLLGAMRAIAQMISYEVPMVLASVVVIMQAGSLSTVAIVDKQAGYTGILPHWFVFTPWGFAGFVLFMIAATAESNRSPFDLPEGESEIIAGYYIEYSGFKFALFFLGEYLGMFATSGLAITLFLGGWSAPFSFLTWIPSYIWFFVKLARADLRLHLDSRNPSAPAHGPAHEFRMEIHPSHGADQHAGRRYLAFHACRTGSLAGMHCPARRPLRPVESCPETQEETSSADVLFCRVTTRL